MSANTYLLVALPSSIHPSNDPAEAFAALQATVPPDSGTVSPFPIPEFKIGTLDALVLQADELAKLDANVEAAVAKVVDVLRSLVDDARESGRHKTVNDSESPLPSPSPSPSPSALHILPATANPETEPVEHYLKSFSWNKVKYRSDRSIAELMDSLHRVPLPLPSFLPRPVTDARAIQQNRKSSRSTTTSRPRSPRTS